MNGSVALQGDKIIINVPYSEANLSAARSLPDREFEKNPEPVWWVPATSYHAEAVLKLFSGVEVAGEVKRLATLSKLPLPEVSVPEGLYQFQEEAVAFIERAGGVAFVGDDPGTGKTVIALGWVYHNGKIFDGLVIAPTVVLYKWKKELSKWLDVESTVIDTVKTPIPAVGWVIMSYTMMRLREEDLKDHKWDTIIFDECHHVKNSKAQQSKVARKVGKNSKYRLMLSGKPFLNQPSELFWPLHIMHPLAFPDWFRFVTRYTLGRDHYWGGLINGDDLKRRLETCLIRRTKREVLTELPDLQRVQLPFKLEHDDEILYLQEESKALEEENPLVASNLLWQAVANAKRRIAVDWAKDFLQDNPDEKLVIYAHHLNVMRYLSQELLPFGVLVIDGSVPAKKRFEKSEMFQTNPRIRVIIIDTAANEGIDLYTASNVLFAEREWVPNTEEQAESRLHRNGQKNAVVAWYLSAIDTFDEVLYATVEEKKALFSKVLRSDEVQTEVAKEVMQKLRERRKHEDNGSGKRKRDKSVLPQ